MGDMRLRTLRAVLTAAIVALPLLASCAEVDPTRARCLAGLWRSNDGAAAALNIREDESARLTLLDGRVWSFALDGAGWIGGKGQDAAARDAKLDDSRCAEGVLSLTDRRVSLQWRRVALTEREVKFQSSGVTLMGKLVVRADDGSDTLVVLLHGGEKRSALASNPLQYLLPAQGVAAFVFDKRGTGRSGGRYTQNFHILAADALAALRTARATVARPIRVGLHGGSQGAWIAPLAALRAPANERPAFVIAAYGLAQSPLDEDREEVFDDLRRRGFGDATTLAKAHEITDATAAVMRSNFTRGFERLNELKERYADAPWYAAIEGEFTGDFLSMPSWLLALIGPFFDEGTSWDYNPIPTIKSLEMPQLWVLAGQDTEAPSATTLDILRKLQTGGISNVDIAVFPQAEHAMVQFEEKGGKRTPVAYVPGYFPLLAAWSRTRQLPEHGGIQAFPGAAPPVYSLPERD